MRRIGIDVGGTNTDAVLVEDDRILASIKTPTTADVTSGITRALADILAASGAAPDSLDAVMIGTTHFTNAVAQRRDASGHLGAGAEGEGRYRLILPLAHQHVGIVHSARGDIDQDLPSTRDGIRNFFDLERTGGTELTT